MGWVNWLDTWVKKFVCSNSKTAICSNKVFYSLLTMAELLAMIHNDGVTKQPIPTSMSNFLLLIEQISGRSAVDMSGKFTPMLNAVDAITILIFPLPFKEMTFFFCAPKSRNGK